MYIKCSQGRHNLGSAWGKWRSKPLKNEKKNVKKEFWGACRRPGSSVPPEQTRPWILSLFSFSQKAEGGFLFFGTPLLTALNVV